jgi:hypothetical protein
MTERQRFIVRAALSYLQANRQDINEAFETEMTRWKQPDQAEISVDGQVGEAIKEDEIEQLMQEGTTAREHADTLDALIDGEDDELAKSLKPIRDFLLN